MDNTITLDKALYASNNNYITKKISISSVLVSVIIALAGIAGFIYAWNLEDITSSLGMALMTFGTIFVLWAIFRIFWKSMEWIYIPTGSVTNEGSCYFDSSDINDLIKIFESKNITRGNHHYIKSNGNIRLDYMLSNDNKFVAAQLLKYIPYTYEPVSEVYYFTNKESNDFAECLKSREF